ncbi:T9SS type A sorting domain-containing protein [Bacteroidota bacterium]
MQLSLSRIKFLAIVVLLFFNNPSILPGQNGPLNGNGGGIIAFTSDRDGNHEIYLMNADGSVQTNITNSSATDMVACWSKDGNRLAFSSTRDNGFEIYIMDVVDITNGIFSDPQRITFNDDMEMGITWSPEGTKIAFDTQVNGEPGIYIYDLVNGGDFQRIDTSPIVGYQPCWSPNGNKIAFCSTTGVYTINVDGTDLQQLTTENCNVPVWSPDGTRIAFVGGSPDEDIYIVNSDGTGLVTVTTNPFNDFVPSWSPEGTMFVYEDDRYGYDEIFTIDIYGWNPTRLTTIGTNTGPVWRPDPNATSVDDELKNSVPQNFKLMQNYPNPFNPTTRINYTVPFVGIGGNVSVQIKIFDIRGKEIKTLVSRWLSPGEYYVDFNAGGLSSGVYFYQIELDNQYNLTKKMCLMK